MYTYDKYPVVWYVLIHTIVYGFWLNQQKIYNFETMISLKYMAVGQSERVCVCFVFYREREREGEFVF